MESNQIPENTIEDQYTWRWRDLLFILFGIVIILVLGVIAFLIVIVAKGGSIESLVKPTVSQTLGLTALEAIALILGVYIFGLRRRGLNWKAVGLRPISWTWFLITIASTLIIIPIVSLVTVGVLYLSGQSLENPQLDFLLPEGLTALDALVMLFLAGFAAPFGEELLFRGVLYSLFRERWGIWLSVLASSVLFGLIHGNFAVGLTGFFLGIIAAILFEYSKSLWTAVLVHSINNSLKIGLLYLLVKLGL